MINTLAAKDPTVDTIYSIDARNLAYQQMRRDWPYALTHITKAPRHTGWYYECTTAGETRAHWPELPRAENETVIDGSVVWTARHPSSSSLPEISNVTWDISPSGLTIASETIEGGILYPVTEDGVDGVSYEVTAHIAWSTGQLDDITVTIPVAQR